MLSSMLIGSEPELAQQDITVTVDGTPEVLSLPAGAYYLVNGDSDLDLCATLAGLCETHSEAPTVSIYLTEGGLVRISVTNAAAFRIAWGTATELRDLLGFTIDLTGALTYTATNPSPLLWIPGRTEIAMARLGTLGDPVYDTAVGQAAGSGVPVATQNNVRFDNEFQWRHVVNDVAAAFQAVRTSSGSQNGKWYGFHERVVRRFRRFWLHRDASYVPASTTAMTYSVAAPGALGPYVLRSPGGTVRYSAPREEEMREAYNRITLPVVLVDEYP